LEHAIQSTLARVRAEGYGSDLHLDESLGSAGPPLGDPRWIDIARAFAEAASREEGRFFVSVALNYSAQLPVDFDVDSVRSVSPDQPPTMNLVAELEPQRTWNNEYYRLSLPEQSEKILVYVSAYRSVDDRAEDEPFTLFLTFETRV
jgi:hypothetical protein